MEKLLNLWNEYEKTLEPNLQIEWTENWVKATPLLIISNEYWFIKWLVDNNKIDFSKLEKIWYVKTVYEHNWQYREIVEYPKYISLLMLLSISNSPIEDLISYLR